MRRRDFIKLIGGAAVAWPLTARAQQPDRVRRIGFLTTVPESDQENRAWIMAFAQRLQELGWIDGRNVRIEYRFGAPDAMQTLAHELLELRPDAIVTAGSPASVELRQRTRTVPVIFLQTGDPIEMGLVQSLAHPEGNVTGFIQFESAIAGKWLEILKELSPSVSRVAIIVDPENPSWKLYWNVIEAAAPRLGVQLTPAAVRNPAEIEQAINAFAHDSNGGLVVTPSYTTVTHSGTIVALAARHRVPAIYPWRFLAAAGGLASYGVDPAELHRQAADYVDRILRGAKPGELPVQAPTKFELVINLKTAKALGLEVPMSLLMRVDKVIE